MESAAYEQVGFMTRVLLFALIVMSSAGKIDCTLLRTNDVNFNDKNLAWSPVYVPGRNRQICISSTKRGHPLLLPEITSSYSRRRTQGACLARRKLWCTLTFYFSDAGIICMRHDTRQIAISSGKGSPVRHFSLSNNWA